jgi:hypothetical protein
MEEYAEDDEELREKFRELKINTRPNQVISNVVFENDKMKRECKYLMQEIQRLRKLLLNPNQKYDKLDDRLSRHNLKVKLENSDDPEKDPKVQVVGVSVNSESEKFEKVHKPKEQVADNVTISINDK